MVNPQFWKNKKVFLTGHTGFKGSWLSLWLSSMGAEVYGYSLDPPTDPSLYKLANISKLCRETISDIRNLQKIKEAISDFQPELVFHLAAQPLVRDSYRIPLDTYEVNVMGTGNLLEASRFVKSVKSIIIITTDKCYENKEWVWGYREIDPLGGYDPYSSSKACAEILASAYQRSFFNPNDSSGHQSGVATVRAGNVIGGGDWAADRLIPDIMRSILIGKKVVIRNPHSIRPWQHVLEPLCGYLNLAEKLYSEPEKFSSAWNFGPYESDAQPVSWIVKNFCKAWGENAGYEIEGDLPKLHEATYLKLDISKAGAHLGWRPRWSLDIAIGKIISWYKAYIQKEDMKQITLQQIGEYNESL